MAVFPSAQSVLFGSDPQCVVLVCIERDDCLMFQFLRASSAAQISRSCAGTSPSLLPTQSVPSASSVMQRMVARSRYFCFVAASTRPGLAPNHKFPPGPDKSPAPPGWSGILSCPTPAEFGPVETKSAAFVIGADKQAPVPIFVKREYQVRAQPVLQIVFPVVIGYLPGFHSRQSRRPMCPSTCCPTGPPART